MRVSLTGAAVAAQGRPGREELTLVLPDGLPIEEEWPAPEVAAKHKQSRRSDLLHLCLLLLCPPPLALQDVLRPARHPAPARRALALDLLEVRLVVRQQRLVLGEQGLVLDGDVVAGLEDEVEGFECLGVVEVDVAEDVELGPVRGRPLGRDQVALRKRVEGVGKLGFLCVKS